MGIDSRWVIEHPEWFISLPEPPYPGYTFGGENLAERRPRRDPARGPLLGQQRRGRRVRAARPADRASGATSTTATTARASRGTTPPSSTSRQAAVREQVIQTIRRRRATVPGDPVRRRDGPRPQARPPAVVPGPRRGRRRDPVAGRVRDDDPGRVRRRDARRVLARGRRPGRRRGPRHAAARRGVLAARGLLRPHPRHAPRLQQRVHAHAPRRGQRGLPAGAQGDARVRPRDPQALRELHEQPRREDRRSSSSARATSTSASRRCSRRCPGCRCSGTASSRASPRSTGWSSGARRWTSSRTTWLVARHEREIVPLLHRRGDFAEARDFLLYDVAGDGGGVDEHVFAYSNGIGPGAVAGRVPQPVRGDVGLDPRLGRVRGQGDRRVEAAGAPDAGGGPRARRRAGRRSVAGVARAAVRARVPALRRGAPRARAPRRAPGLRDARVLGAARAARRGRRLAPAWRSGWAAAACRRWRTRCASSAARARSTTRCGRRSPRHPSLAVDAARRRVADATGTSGDRRRGRRGHPGRWSPRPSPSRRRSTTRSQAAALRRWALLGRWGRWPSGGRRRRDEPGLVRGAAAGAGRRRRAARPGLDEAGRLVGRRARAAAAGPAAAVDARRQGRRAAAAPGGRVARRPGRARVPPDQPLGGRGLVQPRVVARAARLDGSPGAGPHAGGGAGQAAGRALGPDAPPGRGRRGVRLPGRCAARGARGGRRPADRRRARGGSPSRLPKATGLPPGPKDEPRAGDDHEAPKRPPTP